MVYLGRLGGHERALAETRFLDSPRGLSAGGFQAVMSRRQRLIAFFKTVCFE